MSDEPTRQPWHLNVGPSKRMKREAVQRGSVRLKHYATAMADPDAPEIVPPPEPRPVHGQDPTFRVLVKMDAADLAYILTVIDERVPDLLVWKLKAALGKIDKERAYREQVMANTARARESA